MLADTASVLRPAFPLFEALAPALSAIALLRNYPAPKVSCAKPTRAAPAARPAHVCPAAAAHPQADEDQTRQPPTPHRISSGSVADFVAPSPPGAGTGPTRGKYLPTCCATR